MQRPIRIVLLGGQRVVLAGLRLLLENESHLTVVGEKVLPQSHSDRANDAGLPVPSLASTEKADVVIFDIDDGAEALLTVLSPSLPRGVHLMILGTTLDQNTLALAFRHGVTGAVLKQETPEVLVNAIQKVHEGQIWLDQSSTTRLLTQLSAVGEPASPAARRSASLTPRERQVVALVGEGMRNIEVADRLSISEVTVRNHLTSIFRKLKLSSRFQLALYAFKYGLSKLPPKFRATRSAALKPSRGRKKSIS